jgi:uncharacterized protein
MAAGRPRRVWIDLSNSPHPLLFAPVARALEERGHRVLITARDNAQTVALARERWAEVEVIGSESPSRRGEKAAVLAGRIRRLAKWARSHRADVALSHNSYAQIVAARLARVPAVTAMDYEHQPANSVAFRSANRILLPEAVPGEIVEGQGAKPSKVTRYRGLKEQVYLAGFRPDPGILERIGVERPQGGAVVVARSAPAGAAYHPDENPILDDCLRALDARPGLVTVALARHGWQREHLRDVGLGSLVVPDGAVDARSLLFAADAFVGAGGTMSREAALLGLPTWSAFAGERAAVDRWLEAEGRLHALERPEQLDAIGPRTDRGADLDRLERDGNRIRDTFVRAVFEAAGKDVPIEASAIAG